MGLETRNGSGLYFYRKRREGDRVISEYLGSGFAAVFAEGDALDRALKSRNRKREERQQEREMADLWRQVDAYWQQVEHQYRSAMQSAGYHRHNRGEWRKRRTK